MLNLFRFKVLDTVIRILFNIFYQYILNIPQTSHSVIKLFHNGYFHDYTLFYVIFKSVKMFFEAMHIYVTFCSCNENNFS